MQYAVQNTLLRKSVSKGSSIPVPDRSLCSPNCRHDLIVAPLKIHTFADAGSTAMMVMCSRRSHCSMVASVTGTHVVMTIVASLMRSATRPASLFSYSTYSCCWTEKDGIAQ